MHASYQADSMSGASDPQEARLGETVDGGFTVTLQDTNILQHHLDEFQNGDPSLRTQLIDRVMGELYRLCPVNTPFDKKDARNVRHSFTIVQTS
jgi:hypothetical protein